jgi:signal transduction histidine kinase
LDVRDEGQGFDTEAALATSGLGLVSMQERVRLVNGTVAIESKLGVGTTVRATVPLAPNGPDALDPVAHAYSKE